MIFGFDVEKTREDFPMLSKVIYFDSACMSLKPNQVVDKMLEYYKEYTACAGRSAHRLASRVEQEVDSARDDARRLIRARKSKEIIFTRNSTEGINLVANSIGLKKGDEVLISDKEHNSNLVPWLKLGKSGVGLKIAETSEDGTFNIESFKQKINENTKLVSVVFTSNVDGVTNPIKEIAKIAHKNGSMILVDGAQAVPSKEVDVKDIDVDFLVFSGHKMMGPTGTGVLYGKEKILERMDQFIVGGETVTDTTHESYKPEELPMKFEAGLQDYAGIIGLGEACRYLKKIGLANVSKQELKINRVITDSLSSNPRIKILGPPSPEYRSGVYSFNVQGKSPHDIAKMLDVSKKIMVRSGRHCVHSWFNKRNIDGSVRASVYMYNTEEEAKIFAEEVNKISKI